MCYSSPKMSPVKPIALLVTAFAFAILLAFVANIDRDRFLSFLMCLAFGALWMYGPRAFRRWRHLRKHPDGKPG